MRGLMGKVLTCICVALVPAAVAVGAYVWMKVDRDAMHVLKPEYPLYKGYADVPEKTPGLELTAFSVKGEDGQEVQACLARKSGEATPRQQAFSERLKESGWNEKAGFADYVLVCADWDHGIRSALTLTEQLTAAGITCVLWEPRGKASARPYCTYGLEESKDVPLIIDALEKRSGRKDIQVIGIGKRYGADLLLHAAKRDERLHAVAAIDTRGSMNTRLKRMGLSMLSRELVSWRIKSLTGLEPFNIAAVESLFHLPDHVSILLAYTRENDIDSLPEDTIALYAQLDPLQRCMMVIRRPNEPADATTRELNITQKGGRHDIQHHAQAILVQDADDLLVQILMWMREKSDVAAIIKNFHGRDALSNLIKQEG